MPHRSGITLRMSRTSYWPAVFALFACTLFVVVLARAGGDLSLPSLDRAQATFEKTDSRGYNWPWYHQKKAGMDLRCHDTVDRSLRFCTVVLPYVHPKTLEPMGVSFDSFVCSTTTCSWDDGGLVDVNP